MDTDVRPRCAICKELMWWNVRKRTWKHYFEPGDHDATILAPGGGPVRVDSDQ